MRKITKKIASIAAALSVAASCLTPSAYAAGAGKIRIDVVDSSVHGADEGTHNKVNVGDGGMPATLKSYWDAGLTNRDFLYTPEGLGTFDSRKISIFDLGPDVDISANHYTYEQLDALTEDGTAYKCAELYTGKYGMSIEILPGASTPDASDDEAKITHYGKTAADDVVYVLHGDGKVTMTKGGNDTQYEDSKGTPFEKCGSDFVQDNNWYVMIEDSNAANSHYGYKPSVDDASGKAWQVIFQYKAGTDIDLRYDENVASKSTIGIPLHNEVFRSNFSFRLVDKDLQAYASQGKADIADGGGSKPKFAVYSINSTAEGWTNDGESPAGYVVADRNCDGTLSEEESVSYVPAYTEDQILAAYEAYLVECGKTAKTSGNYKGLTDLNGADVYKSKVKADGEFVIGTYKDKNGAEKPIIPVMILEPDENGVVKTYSDTSNPKASGLPTGNYIILQVQAGDGYYIDQDFRPIVSAGYWAGTPGTDYTQYVGYGRSYYTMICNTFTETLTASNTEKKPAAKTNSPVAFIPAGKVTDLSAINSSNARYFVAANGSLTGNPNEISSWLRSDGPIYAKNAVGASNGKYILNAKDARMQPVEGTSRFTAQDPVIRAGFKAYMADSDDITHRVDKLNLDKDGVYIILPQGNGSLDGAQFELKPHGAAANNSNKLYTTGVTVQADGTHIYTARDNMILVPLDDLPFGTYQLKQVKAGAGYAVGDFGIGLIAVNEEDKVSVLFSDQVDEDGDPIIKDGKIIASALAPNYTNGDRTHIPNDLISGGEVYTLNSSTAPAGSEITISVYNISEQYVYVDKDDNGSEERFETNKYTYKNQIAGKPVTYDMVKNIVKSWIPCREIKVRVGGTVSHDNTLPYGTYLAVVTDVPEGYDVTGDFMGTGVIADPDDDLIFETSIDDLLVMPRIDTVFMDAENRIDSIAIQRKVFLRDNVTASNLVGGMDYAIYGSVIDKSTGNLLQPGMIAYAAGTAYLSTDDDANTGAGTGDSQAANLLLTEGAKFNSYSDDYVKWVLDVRDFATAINNQTLIGYCNAAVTTGSGDTSHIAEFNDGKSKITGTLKYIARGEMSTDVKLDGTLEVEVNFDALDTRKLEGKTLVAYDYVCSGTGAPDKKAMAAESTGALLEAIDPVLVTAHRSLNDEDQTVYLPTLDIDAEATYTGAKTIDPSETVTGIVSYGNLEIGNKYAVEAWLVDAYGAKIEMVDEDGNLATSMRREFTAYAPENELEFEFGGLDASKYNNQRLTVYSTLYRVEGNQLGALTDYKLVTKGDADSMGYSINDREPGKNQVDVEAPTVTTKFTDSRNRQIVNFDGMVSLKDTVNYKGLVVGGSYNAVLTIVDGEGTQLYDDEGNELKAEYRFTATKPDMVITIPIKFKGTDLRGMDIIAYNDLYRQTENKIALVAQEHNPLEEDQTIEATGEGYKIVITTVAKNPDNNTHVVAATGNSSAVDDVTVKNLNPDTQYMAKTELAYAKNGNVITQFAPVETYFDTDENGSAKFSVNISFNALVFKGETLVVYQTIYDMSGDNIIAVHNDYLDANQMLMVPDIDTTATADDGISKLIVPDEKKVSVTNDPDGKKETVYKATVLDNIKYTNLIAGNPYQITTEVVTSDGGSTVGTKSMAFTPMTSSGTVTSSIDLDVTGYRGKKLVVYETITDTYSGAEVVIHKDLSDADQTVEIIGDEDPEDPDNPSKPEDPDNPDNPDNPDDPGKPGGGKDIDTGVDEKYGLLFGIGGGILAIAAILTGVLIYRKKRKD